MAAVTSICAGRDNFQVPCSEPGRFTCQNCYLTTYCGAACQRADWAAHKVYCKSSLAKVSWQPAWVLEGRRPTFIQEGIAQTFGKQNYYWGNLPAIDVLRLKSAEGVDYQGPLSLLFAASGDIRNVIKTIVELPPNFTRDIDITINDVNLDIVARNVIILLIALVIEDVEEAIDCIIHVWYSAFLRTSHMEILQQHIRPLIQEVCAKTRTKDPSSLLRKTWKFRQHSLRIALAQSAWNCVLRYMDQPPGLETEKANRIRRSVTLADGRKDYRDRHSLLLAPACRVAKHRFREDGLLLPFGSHRDKFIVPNPTFFQTADEWPMFDNADPLYGWLMEEVEATFSGLATADIYGKLFYHLRNTLRSFCSRLSKITTSFHLLAVDALSLPQHLERDKRFSRIEVSNISDCGYVGPHHTVIALLPLLQDPAVNPCATLIMLFMNAIEETMTKQDQIADATGQSISNKRLLKYMLPGRPIIGSYDPALIKFTLAREVVTLYDKYFDRFMDKYRLAELARLTGGSIQDKNRIIEKWPYKLKLTPDRPGAKEEFDRALRSGVTGKERYMEWVRVE